jgi:hypothetical protein
MDYEIEENDEYQPPKFLVVDEYGEIMENDEGESLFNTKDEAQSLINDLELNAKEIEVDFLLADLNVEFKFTVHIDHLGIDPSNSKDEIEKAIYSFFRQTPIDIEEYKFV